MCVIVSPVCSSCYSSLVTSAQPATLASVGGKFVADISNDFYHKRNTPVYICWVGDVWVLDYKVDYNDYERYDG